MLLGDAVEFGARKFADRPAIIFDDEITTFAGLRDRVNRLSNGLLQLTAPGERVAILSENRPQFVEAYAGVPMAGMGLTFLNYRLNPKELAQIVDRRRGDGAAGRAEVPAPDAGRARRDADGPHRS